MLIAKICPAENETALDSYFIPLHFEFRKPRHSYIYTFFDILISLVIAVALAKSLNAKEAEVIILRRQYLKPAPFHGNDIKDLLKELNNRVFPYGQKIESFSFLKPNHRYNFGLEAVNNVLGIIINHLATGNEKSSNITYLDTLLKNDQINRYRLVWAGGYDLHSYLKPGIDLELLLTLLSDYNIRIEVLPILLSFNRTEVYMDIGKVVDALQIIENDATRSNLPVTIIGKDEGCIIPRNPINVLNIIKQKIIDVPVSEINPHHLFHEVLVDNVDKNYFMRGLPSPDLNEKRNSHVILPMLIIDDGSKMRGDIGYLTSRILSIICDIPALPMRYSTLIEKVLQKREYSVINNIIRGIFSRSHVLPLTINRITLMRGEREIASISPSDLERWLAIATTLYKVGNRFCGVVSALAWIKKFQTTPTFRHRVYFTVRNTVPALDSDLVEDISKPLNIIKEKFSEHDAVLLEFPFILEHMKHKECKTYLRKILNTSLKDYVRDHNTEIFVVAKSDLRLPRIYERSSNDTIDAPREEFYILDSNGLLPRRLYGISTIVLGATPYRLQVPRGLEIYKVFYDQNTGNVDLREANETDIWRVLPHYKALKILRLNTPVHTVRETVVALAAIKYREIMRMLHSSFVRDDKLQIAIRSIGFILDKMSRANPFRVIELYRSGIWSLI